MMPRKFPDLSVEEENEKVFPKLQHSWFSEELSRADPEISNLVGGGQIFFSKAGDQVPGHLLI